MDRLLYFLGIAKPVVEPETMWCRIRRFFNNYDPISFCFSYVSVVHILLIIIIGLVIYILFKRKQERRQVIFLNKNECNVGNSSSGLGKSCDSSTNPIITASHSLRIASEFQDSRFTSDNEKKQLSELNTSSIIEALSKVNHYHNTTIPPSMFG